MSSGMGTRVAYKAVLSCQIATEGEARRCFDSANLQRTGAARKRAGGAR